MNKRITKKISVTAVNAILGGLIGGGTGALVGVISSLDSGVISTGIDKLLQSSEHEETEEEVMADVMKEGGEAV